MKLCAGPEYDRSTPQVLMLSSALSRSVLLCLTANSSNHSPARCTSPDAACACGCHHRLQAVHSSFCSLHLAAAPPSLPVLGPCLTLPACPVCPACPACLPCLSRLPVLPSGGPPLRLGLLPIKDPSQGRTANLITLPDHPVWNVKDGETMYRVFEQAFPQVSNSRTGSA